MQQHFRKSALTEHVATLDHRYALKTPVHRSYQEEVAKIVLTKEENAVVAQHYPRDNMAALWQNIVKFHSDTFPNLLKLAPVALLLPVHTADVKRGFSSQNCILTPKRNRLAINTQNMLMKVKMEGEKERKAEYIRRTVPKWGQKTTATKTKKPKKPPKKQKQTKTKQNKKKGKIFH